MNSKPMYWCQQFPTGSAYLFGDGQDVDWVTFVHPEDKTEALAWYLGQGFVESSSEYDGNDDGWQSLRKGRCNVILCWDAVQYIGWVAYSLVGKALVTADAGMLSQKMWRVELAKALIDRDPKACQNIIHCPEFNTFAGSELVPYICDHLGDV